MRIRSICKLITCFAAIILLCLSVSPSSAETIIYNYDDLNRLEKVQYPDGTIVIYSYDNVGNRLEKKIDNIDLLVTGVSGPTEVHLSQQVTITTAVRNQGTSSSGQFYVGSYLSSDSVVTTDDRLLGYENVNVLSAGAQVTFTTSITIPTDTITGAYYLGAIADYTGVTLESNKANNILVGNSITVRLPILSIIKVGTGSGTVETVPTNLSCGTTCTGNYNLNSAVTLTAAPSAGSLFSGWSGGGCSGLDNCDVVVNADLNITAIFNVIPPNSICRISGGSPVYFQTVQSAYDAAVDGSVIQCKGESTMGSLNINRNISVALNGGYNSDFTSQSGNTTLHGSINVMSGIATIKNFILTQ